LRLRSALIELDSAHRAAIVILEPVSETCAIKSMFAGELAAVLSILALFKADVALRFFIFLLLRERGDIAFRAAGRAGPLLLSVHVCEKEAACLTTAID